MKSINTLLNYGSIVRQPSIRGQRKAGNADLAIITPLGAGSAAWNG
jgi:hypothetical protein